MSVIDDRYQQLGGSKGFLGKPTTGETVCPDGAGHYRHFEHGSIYSHPKTVALHRYYNPSNGDHFYVADPSTTPGGYIDEGVACYGYQQQDSGTVALHRYYNPGNGDHFYITDPSTTPQGYVDEGVACYVYPAPQIQPAQGGVATPIAIPAGFHLLLRFYNPGNGDHFYMVQPEGTVSSDCTPPGYLYEGFSCLVRKEHSEFTAFEVHGDIRAKWSGMGWERSFLGYPITDETKTPDGIGRYNHFQYGSIYWTPTTGSFEVHGAIRSKWSNMGWELSFLGYPITDESTTPNGIGRYNHFQHGSIYWSPNSDAHEVHGDIKSKWANLGWEQSFLGYPITDEMTTPDGVGRYNHFQGGSIYWTPSTGPHEVHGDILAKWSSLGWEKSSLGYPISDEMAAPDGIGRYSKFEHGLIYWAPGAGTHVMKGSGDPKLKIRIFTPEYRWFYHWHSDVGFGTIGTGGLLPDSPPPGTIKVGYENIMDDPWGPGYEYRGWAHRGFIKSPGLQQLGKVFVVSARLEMDCHNTVWQVGASSQNFGSVASGLSILDAPLNASENYKYAFNTPSHLYATLPSNIGATEKAKYSAGSGYNSNTNVMVIGHLNIDVAEPVRSWVEGTTANYGFIVYGPNENFSHNNDKQLSIYGSMVLTVEYLDDIL